MTEPYYQRDGVTLYCGDNRDVLPALAVAVSAVVTDPPYGLSFMGNNWDHSVPGEAFWRVIGDAMLPGAHLLSFGGTRTFHRIAVAIEDAGFEIRDTLMWLYGSGFPKSHDVSKAIDKAAGAGDDVRTVTSPATPDAERWQGWGTALKPAYEPIILARKPLAGTVAANVLAHGTGALNIDASRISTHGETPTGSGRRDSWRDLEGRNDRQPWNGGNITPESGRWPANVLLDEDAAQALDAQSGERKSGGRTRSHMPSRSGYNGGWKCIDGVVYGDTGGASRFFYVARASRAERLRGVPNHIEANHPTVKPLALMRWLVTLVTPPNGVVLDPFAGSGTTGVACAELGVPCILIEQSPEYCEIIARRVDHALDERARTVRQPALEMVAD